MQSPVCFICPLEYFSNTVALQISCKIYKVRLDNDETEKIVFVPERRLFAYLNYMGGIIFGKWSKMMSFNPVPGIVSFS